ncbi:MAG: hypothetical protein GTO55_08125 [Armatimonadetes bacterium]|nr:hypothetical protein [Armatimonadota bacterium]NIM24219.1 hypothetical protein [Armatimonadota bacterium]NIM68088.1 hypothetical protein [Armatimonadota bacterium]NIM76550.1 hypothetical protein [Armatimonadota bacterium]NIN06293.1 hypothetical protein [Armatimonadota bacterium]
MTPWKIKITPAGRKWDRMFSQAVARSIEKTVTELVTNSWDSYKRIGRLPHSSGIVDAILALKEGERVDHDSLIATFPRRQRVAIKVSIAASGTRRGIKKRECRVVDQAAGMDSDELRRSLEWYGEEKTGQTAGERGLFGQGLSDVVFGHQEGTIVSFKDGHMRRVRTYRDKDRQPNAEELPSKAASRKEREDWGIERNGTFVSVILSRECRIPDAESLYERLCNFYMLRMINADPSVCLSLEQRRPGGSKPVELSYNFPPGRLIRKFESSFQYELNGQRKVRLQGVAVRADEPLKQDVMLGKETREGGFLVVDETDTVYDLTLFDYENKPGLDRLYGVVRLVGAREILKKLLNSPRPVAVITESRDGFDLRKEFTKTLWKAMHPILKPIVDAEAEIRQEDIRISKETNKKIDQAFKKLNQFFERETEKEEDGTGSPEPKAIRGILFDPPGPLSLHAGIPREIRLLGEAPRLASDGEVVLSSTNPDISLQPDRFSISRARKRSGRFAFAFRVVSNAVGRGGKVEAIADEVDGDLLNSELVIRSVMPPPILLPPENGMEFRPTLASASPHRKGVTFLFIDTKRIPIDSEIHIRMEKGPGGLALLTGDETSVLALPPLRVSSSHLVKDMKNIARIPVYFRGQAKGQEREIVAKAKGSNRHKYHASATVQVRESEQPVGGEFREPDYRRLDPPLVSRFDEGIIWVSSAHPLNRAIFGTDRESFWRAIEDSQTAQVWLADVILQEAMYHTLATKFHQGGKKGFTLDEHDPVGAVRKQMESWKHEEGGEVFRTLVNGLSVPRFPK